MTPTGDAAKTDTRVVKAGQATLDPLTVSMENIYSATGEGEIKVKKELKGRKWDDDDEFTFTLSGSGDAPMPAETRITITKDDENQTASFGEIEFNAPGKYVYTVKETKGDIEGVKYDTKKHKVVIKVVDDGKGHLVAKNGTSMIRTVKITNTYKSDKPDTGDTNNIAELFSLMGASALGLIYMAFRRRREQE